MLFFLKIIWYTKIGAKMSNIIEQIEKSNIEASNKKLPPFSVGDSVSVQVNVVEGEKKRKQAFEGVVIAKGIGELILVLL